MESGGAGTAESVEGAGDDADWAEAADGAILDGLVPGTEADDERLEEADDALG